MYALTQAWHLLREVYEVREGAGGQPEPYCAWKEGVEHRPLYQGQFEVHVLSMQSSTQCWQTLASHDCKLKSTGFDLLDL